MTASPTYCLARRRIPSPAAARVERREGVSPPPVALRRLASDGRKTAASIPNTGVRPVSPEPWGRVPLKPEAKECHQPCFVFDITPCELDATAAMSCRRGDRLFLTTFHLCHPSMTAASFLSLQHTLRADRMVAEWRG